ESLIERLSRLDPLTGLLNRDAFEHQVERAVLQPHRRLTGLAVLHIGLDRFDLVGEQIGLAATEPLLVQLAQRLIGIVRRTDAVGRLERDEFAILQVMPGGAIDPAALAERILEEICTRFTVNDQSVKLTLNIGVAIHPTDGSTARELMRNAALASAQARRDGRNGWRSFESGMEQRLRERQILRRDLRVALTKNQFTLNYQPIVDAMTFEIAGYEALLRWDHPERGRIPPADFIPVAEESGLIVAIGTWVLATACAEAVSWERPATIAVNLSPVQFNDPGLVATVAEVLHRTGLPAARLELEITETILIDDKRKALEVLTELKRLGVRLAMDDFGTGYSSLSYLRSFPFDKIKIDRSFIRDVEHDAEAESIVQAIIAMGLSLHLKITAEGVETKQQLAMLRAYGCSYLQGFLLGKPASASEIEGRGSAVPMAAAFPAGPIADALGMLAASARPN
ncbi:MAG TPA: bifunctional diguanylate cyclase/phosphodiesterase, partial [Rhodopila sp.]|nr:bifunctional diguanylate cyclase/phosphodiesterase [Rhodopila sp.]